MNEQGVIQEREPGVFISKTSFEMLKINPTEKYGKYIQVEGKHQYDFKFQDLEEAKGFYIELINEAITANTFDVKAITEIGNEILNQFQN